MKRLLTFLTLALLTLYSCAPKQDDKTSQETTTHQRVEVVSPHLDTISITDTYTAHVEAFVKNNIAPQTPNRIAKIWVEVGATVRRGQLLATLDDATLQQQELRVKNLQADYQRVEELYKVGGIAKSQYEAQKMNYDVALSALNNLKQNTLLTAPIAGVVTQRNYDSGDMYSPGIPLMVVEQIAPLKLLINASEKHFNRIQKGMRAEVSINIFPNETFAGKVALIHPTIDPNTRTFQVEVHLPNGDNRVRPGMFASVQMHIGDEAVMLLPDIAVLSLPGTNQRYVYTLKEGKATYTEIKVEGMHGSHYIVTEGLSVNDQVITSGLSTLKNGQEVNL